MSFTVNPGAAARIRRLSGPFRTGRAGLGETFLAVAFFLAVVFFFAAIVVAS
jgi:hypothetical protein